MSATLYRNTNGGVSEVFTNNDDCLTNNSIGNDTVSSISVTPGTSVTLYEHCSYRWHSRNIHRGLTLILETILSGGQQYFSNSYQWQ